MEHVPHRRRAVIFRTLIKPRALTFAHFLCALYTHLMFVEVLQMEKNSHFVEFEMLSSDWFGSFLTAFPQNIHIKEQ